MTRITSAIAFLLSVLHIGGCGDPIPPDMKMLKELSELRRLETNYHMVHGRYARVEDIGGWADFTRKRSSNGIDHGYDVVFELTKTGYIVRALPRLQKSHGIKSFYMDETGYVRYAFAPDAATDHSPIWH